MTLTTSLFISTNSWRRCLICKLNRNLTSQSQNSGRNPSSGYEPKNNYDSYGNDFVELKSLVNSPKFASENLPGEDIRNKAVTFGAEGCAKEEIIRRDNEVGLWDNLLARRNIFPQRESKSPWRGKRTATKQILWFTTLLNKNRKSAVSWNSWSKSWAIG